MWFNEYETYKDSIELSDTTEFSKDDSYRKNDNELEEDNVFTQFFIDNIMGGF